MDENIKYIIAQTGVDEIKARESLEIDNDVVNAIIRILEPEKKELCERKDFSVKIEPRTKHQKKIAELREILKDKDELFKGIQDKKKEETYIIEQKTQVIQETKITKI